MNYIENNLDGWLVINKDEGMTSRQVVNIVKKTLNVKKVGHAGTLDPLATGVLVLAVGKATKAIKYVMDGMKKYNFTIKWGCSTDTIDAEGKNETFISRIREDKTINNGLNLWIVSDNLLRGAALNAVEIAETLIKNNFYGK